MRRVLYTGDVDWHNVLRHPLPAHVVTCPVHPEHVSPQPASQIIVVVMPLSFVIAVVIILISGTIVGVILFVKASSSFSNVFIHIITLIIGEFFSLMSLHAYLNLKQHTDKQITKIQQQQQQRQQQLFLLKKNFQ